MRLAALCLAAGGGGLHAASRPSAPRGSFVWPHRATIENQALLCAAAFFCSNFFCRRGKRDLFFF